MKKLEPRTKRCAPANCSLTAPLESWVSSPCAVLVISTGPQDQRPRDGVETCLVPHSAHSEKDMVLAQRSWHISKGEDLGPQTANMVNEKVKSTLRSLKGSIPLGRIWEDFLEEAARELGLQHK